MSDLLSKVYFMYMYQMHGSPMRKTRVLQPGPTDEFTHTATKHHLSPSLKSPQTNSNLCILCTFSFIFLFQIASVRTQTHHHVMDHPDYETCPRCFQPIHWTSLMYHLTECKHTSVQQNPSTQKRKNSSKMEQSLQSEVSSSEVTDTSQLPPPPENEKAEPGTVENGTPVTPRYKTSTDKERLRSNSSPMTLQHDPYFSEEETHSSMKKSKSVDSAQWNEENSEVETPRGEVGEESLSSSGYESPSPRTEEKSPAPVKRTSSTSSTSSSRQQRSNSAPQKPKLNCSFTTLGCSYASTSTTNLNYHEKLCPYGKLRGKILDMKDEINATHQALHNLHMTTCHKEMEVQNLRKKNQRLEENLIHMVEIVERMMAECMQERNYVRNVVMRKLRDTEGGGSGGTSSSQQQRGSTTERTAEQIAKEWETMVKSHVLNGLPPQRGSTE